MNSASTSKAALELEIARLTGMSFGILFHPCITVPVSGAINRHKSGSSTPSTGQSQAFPRSNTYINPNYKPAVQKVRPAIAFNVSNPQIVKPPTTTERKEVVLGGVAFESSGRSLVRKDREFTLCCSYLMTQGISSLAP
jgi:hypothetical protein